MNSGWLLAGLLFMRLAVAAPPLDGQTQDMIRRVEAGLLHSVQIGVPRPMKLEDRLQVLNVPGLSIAVVKDFEVQWTKCYGVCDLRTGAAVTEETLFQAASITKSISALVTLRLVQDEVLDLDRDVNLYLERWQVPENEFTRVEKVTLRRLLSHTAGLTVSGMEGYAQGDSVPTVLQVLDGLPPAKNVPIRVDKVPGSGYRYSGGGYTVLQLLLEDVTGRPYPDLAAEYVFRPAGMTRSTICPACPSSSAQPPALGHSVDAGGKLTEFKGHAFIAGGSGCCGLWTTPSDLARLLIAMQKALRGAPGSILSQDMARAMITAQENSPTGLGYKLLHFDDATYFYHNGGNPGFAARYIGHPDKGYGFAVMFNSDTGFSLIDELTLSVGTAYGWDGVEPSYYKDVSALVDGYRQRKQQAPEDSANSEVSLAMAGNYLLNCGYKEAAIGIFLLNQEFNPRSADCCDRLAKAYEQAGDQARALQCYRQAIERLDQFAEENRSFQSRRAETSDKIRRLEDGSAR